MMILTKLFGLLLFFGYSPVNFQEKEEAQAHCLSISSHYFDELYCQSTNGVNLRTSQDIESEIIAKIGFGEKINRVPGYSRDGIVNGQHGKWIKAKYKNSEGFVFSPYFGEYKLRKPYDGEEISDYVLSFLDMVISDSVVHVFDKISSRYRGYSDILNYNLYQCGSMSYLHFGHENANRTFITNQVDPNQIYNLMKIYHVFGSGFRGYGPPEFKDEPITGDFPALHEASYATNDGEVVCKTENNRTEISIYYSGYAEDFIWTDLVVSNNKVIDIVEITDAKDIAKGSEGVIRYEFLKTEPYYYRLIAFVALGGKEFKSILPMDIIINSIEDLDSAYQVLLKDDHPEFKGRTDLPNQLFRFKGREEGSLVVYFNDGWKSIKK